MPSAAGTSERQPPEPAFPERELHLGWFDWLTRHRVKLYALLTILYVAAFNGLWRVGVDSALYRGLARSLARGEGYVFAGEHHRHAYPGLPWMLSVLDRIFGESAVPALILMTVMAIATLWLIDRTIALRYPLWVAMVVTIAMALNVRFIRQSQQIMTDVPFTLGVMMSIYALERLRLLAINARWTSVAKFALLMLVGLALAAATRPTFGVLAGAIVLASSVRLIRGNDGRRWLDGGILAAALLVLLALFLVDPRTVGIAPLQGVYEQELVERVQELPRTLLGRLDTLLSRDLNDAFFSQRIWPVGYIGSLLVLVASAMVIRRNMAWGIMIFGLIAVTVPLSSVPRYYLMVLPFMYLGWTLLWCRVTLRIPAQFQGPVLALALGFPMMANGGRSVGFVQEQRAPDIAWLLHYQDRSTAFYTKYRDGIVFKQQRIAKMIANHATPTQTVIGPDAHVLAYLADRRVIGERTLFIDRDAAFSKMPQLLANAKPDLAIFPLNAYGDNDTLMRDMIRRRILAAGKNVAKIDEAQLAVASVRKPPAGTNWRDYRAPTEGSTTRSATKRKPTTQQAELNAKRERKRIQLAKAQRAEKQAKLERQAKLNRRAKVDRQKQRDAAAKRERDAKRQRLLKRQQNAQTKPATAAS